MGSYVSREDIEGVVPEFNKLFMSKEDYNKYLIDKLEERVEKLESIIQNLNNEHILQQNQ